MKNTTLIEWIIISVIVLNVAAIVIYLKDTDASEINAMLNPDYDRARSQREIVREMVEQNRLLREQNEIRKAGQ
jgi:hypothetical protein